MLSTSLLLKNKLNQLPKNQRREYLLKCIDNNTDLFLDDEIITEIIDRHICTICKKNDFLKDKYQEICQSCGNTRDIPSTQKNFEKIEYIVPGQNLVKILKDGKQITIDLNKINLWIQELDPLARDTTKILDALDVVLTSKGLTLTKTIQNTAISLWYNFNTLYKKQNLKTTYKKKGILALCVYYSCSINNIIVSLEQLSLIFNINVRDILISNDFLKSIFKDSEYFSQLNLNYTKKCELELPLKTKLILIKIKNDLIHNFPSIKDPLENKEYASIVYYITNNIQQNSLYKYTLKELSESCDVSATTISSTNKSIIKFYRNKPELYKNLLI